MLTKEKNGKTPAEQKFDFRKTFEKVPKELEILQSFKINNLPHFLKKAVADFLIFLNKKIYLFVPFST